MSGTRLSISPRAPACRAQLQHSRYSPALGRFYSVDPVPFSESNPKSFNRYAYGNNNPYTYRDPDGRDAIEVVRHWWESSVIAFKSDSLGDAAWRAIQAIPGEGAVAAGLGAGIKAVTGIAKAGVARAVATEGKTVLGHFPEYKQLGDSLNARTFNVPEAVWKRMSEAERWMANQKFLDRVMSRGDEIILATPLDRLRPGTYFARELEYLGSKGYVPSADGTRLIKP